MKDFATDAEGIQPGPPTAAGFDYLNGTQWASVALAIYSLITIAINVLLIVVFCNRRSLATVSNRFVVNLLLINVLSSFFLIPAMIMDLQLCTSDLDTLILTRHAPFLTALSKVAQFSLNFTNTASILSILLIGIDQYLAVVHPMTCHRHVTKSKSSLLIGTVHLLSLTAGLCASWTDSNAVFFANVASRPQQHMQQQQQQHFLGSLFTAIYFSTVIVSPFVAICLLYMLIYNAAHKNSQRMRQGRVFSHVPPCSATVRLPKVRSAPSFTNGDHLQMSVPLGRTSSDRSLVPQLITALRSKLSNASVFKYREEHRTAKISALVIVMVLTCHVPYGVAQMLQTRLATYLFSVSLCLLVLSNLLSPVLFALRNRRVRRELKSMLCTDRHAQKQQQRLKPKIVVDSVCCTAQEADPFLVKAQDLENGKGGILKRVCSAGSWSKKCTTFMAVPDSCLEARGSFSSASTQLSCEE